MLSGGVNVPGSVPDISPPRERKKPQLMDTRKFSWATQRIHDLEKELEHAKAKIKVGRHVPEQL